MPPPGPPEQTLDYHFPKAGLHTADAFGRQPTRQVGRGQGQFVRTTADNQNVRSYDVVSGRDRGGSRSGLSKYVADKVPVTLGGTDEWIVQSLSILATTQNSVPAVQQSPSGRVVYLLAVSQGKIKFAFPDATGWTATTNVTGEEPELNVTGLVRSSANNQKMYFVDGTNYVYYDPPTNEVRTWSATSGTLPEDDEGNRARLIATWRGRTVLSGLLRDPQNWFLSKVSDPYNFEYAPSPITKTDAVAGNNSPLGLIGDVVTGLVPYTDDVLIFLGDHTIYAMKGDPADGGQIDLISDITGAAFGEAWCKDPYGNVYFFGSKPSVWRMGGANQPERISQPIEPLLKDINTGTNVIRLVWNDTEQSVYVYVTPDDAPGVTTHYVWEYRSNSWNKDKFGNTSHNPLCCVAFDGNDADDRAVLIGSWDGYVRFLDPNASDDDGTPIQSYVFIGPILTQTIDTMLLKEIQYVMATASGQVTWEIYSGSTAEAALAAAARKSGTASGGRNGTQPVRVADHAIYIKISATTRWAMEVVRAVFAGRGKVRRRRP